MDIEKQYLKASADIGSIGMALHLQANLLSYTERNIAMHAHRIFEMHFLYSGKALLETERGNVFMNAGDIILIPPHLYHSIVNITETFHLMAFTFNLYKIDKNECGDSNGQLHDLVDAITVGNVILLHDHIELIQAFDRLLRELSMPGMASSYLIEAYIAEFLVYLVRALMKVSDRENVSPQQHNIANTIDLVRMGKIESYFANNFTSASMHNLAKELSLSEQHVRRILRNNYNMSFSGLLNKQRINVSKQLLRNTDKTITEIWQLAGFNTPASFSMAFRKYAGGTPSEYRANSHKTIKEMLNPKINET